MVGDPSIRRVYFDKPTKGEPNSSKHYSAYAAAPVFSDHTLYHAGAFSVVISCSTSDARIFYTLDGSEPTSSSPVYSDPITIHKNTPVRARAIADGLLASDIGTATYLFDTPHTVPVFCITGNPGAMRIIVNTDSRNYKPEFAATVGYYEADGSLGVSFASGISPKGRSSLEYPQNSLSLKLRGSYGMDSVTYPFFGNGTVSTFSALTLRNAGQDCMAARIRDPFFETLAEKSLNVDGTECKSVAVYVNGVYNGLYDLNEDQNEDYFASHFGVASDNIDLIERNNTVIYGDSEEFMRVNRLARTWDLKDDEVFAEFAKLVDVDACTDYLIARIYFGDGDVINQRFWRAQDYSVKWRPLLFDLDWSFRFNDASRNKFNRYFTPTPAAGNGTITNMYIFCALRKNKAWCDRFVERFVELAVTKFDSPNMLTLYDSMVATMEPEMERHIARWHTPRSMTTWRSEIAKLRSALERRQAVALKQLKNYFHVSDGVMQEYIRKYSAISLN